MQAPDAPFTGASSSLAPGVFGALDLVQLSARAKEGKSQASFDALLLELERVKRHGFLQSELDRAKANLLRALEHAVSAEATADPYRTAANLANHFLTGNVVTSAESDLSLGTRLLGEMTVAALNARVASWYGTQQQVLLVSGPSREALPEKSSLLGALSAVAARPVDPPKEQGAEVPLLAASPTPGSITKEEQIAEVGLTVWTLSNGARVVLKPTDFEDDEILSKAISFGGNAVASADEFQTARFATNVVLASGLGALDRQALQQTLTGKMASAWPWMDEQSEGIRGKASPEDVETLFQLIHLYATAPRRDPGAFEAFRQALREGVGPRFPS